MSSQSKAPKPLDPANFAKNGTEHGHQVALFCWASQHQTEYPELQDMFAIPNGGERDDDQKTAMIRRSSLKAEGVKAGTLDICLPIARAGCHGLFIELKRPKSPGKAAGTASPEQLKTIDKLRSNGYGACVCVGWEAARDVLIQYLTWKG